MHIASDKIYCTNESTQAKVEPLALQVSLRNY